MYKKINLKSSIYVCVLYQEGGIGGKNLQNFPLFHDRSIQAYGYYYWIHKMGKKRTRAAKKS